MLGKPVAKKHDAEPGQHDQHATHLDERNRPSYGAQQAKMVDHL